MSRQPDANVVALDEALQASAETVMRDWNLAKLWLLRELKGTAAAGSTGTR